MSRIKLIIAVAAVVAAMLAISASPAMAHGAGGGGGGGGHASGNGGHVGGGGGHHDAAPAVRNVSRIDNGIAENRIFTDNRPFRGDRFVRDNDFFFGTNFRGNNFFPDNNFPFGNDVGEQALLVAAPGFDDFFSVNSCWFWNGWTWVWAC